MHSVLASLLMNIERFTLFSFDLEYVSQTTGGNLLLRPNE